MTIIAYRLTWTAFIGKAYCVDVREDQIPGNIRPVKASEPR